MARNDVLIPDAPSAVALWVPFNVAVRDKVPSAIKLTDASAYYPEAAIIGGWAAANTYYDVTIDRVSVGGTNRTYTYFFRIVA